MQNLEELRYLNILYVEDDVETLELYSSFLSYYVANVHCCSSSLQALEVFEDESIDVIITDIDMPVLDGIQLITRIRKRDSKVRILVLTGYTDANYTIPSIELDITRYLVKPVSKTALFDALKKCSDEVNGGERLIELGEDTFFNMQNRELIVADTVQKLQKKPSHLLYLLIKNKNQTLSYEYLTKEMSTDKIISINSIRCHIRTLRSSFPQLKIQNSSGFGYKLDTKKDK
ncbi:MAG: response regulator transcription factor [Campylobacterota bacterium]